MSNRVKKGQNTNKSKKKRAPDLAWWKIISGSFAVMATFWFWYFNRCYDERKETISEVKTAFAALLTAQDQAVESFGAVVQGLRRVIIYIKSDASLDNPVFQSQKAELIAVSRNAGAACDKYTDSANRYVDAEVALGNAFLIKTNRLALRKWNAASWCSIWGDNVLNAITLNSTILSNRFKRDAWVTRQEKVLVQDQLSFYQFSQRCDECARIMNDRLQFVESRRLSVTLTCWDCARRLFSVH